jgi:serine/threonine protein kinase
MTQWLDDKTLTHLRDVSDWPDLGERYEVSRRLGRGGMGVVYAAHDRLLDRDVAIKVLDDLRLGADPGRVLSEARILSRLEHPGIVPVHDAGTLPDGRAYYVMKLVRGAPLDVALGGRSLNERLDVFLRICDAVSFAHDRGIVHRDLKPDNIMLGAFGEVLVMDWGIAHVHDAGTRKSSDPGFVAGTPGYMAPEQERGAAIDDRADVYALGVILDSIVPAPRPRPLSAVADRARAASAGDRYASVQAMTHDVIRFRDGLAVSAYRETVTERAARFYQRYQLPILLVLAYVIMRVVLLAWRGV